MYNGQLEMSFANGRSSVARVPRQRRLSRAQWWFQRMRQAVDCAMDWQAVPPPRAEQTWFPAVQKRVCVDRRAA